MKFISGKRLCGIYFGLFLSTQLFGQAYDFRRLSVEDGLAQSQILSLFQDKRGALWMGTNGGGVCRYDGHQFVNYSRAQGLADDVVFSITEDMSGNLIFGTTNGLSVFDGKKFRNYSTGEGLPSERIYKVLCDRKGLIWIGSFKGVTLWDGQHFRPFSGNDSIQNGLVFSLFEDDIGRMWVGSFTNGALCYDGEKIRMFSQKQGLKDTRVRSIGQDASGSVWLGTGNGLYKITEEIVEEVKVPLNDQEQLSVNSIIRDRKGRLWLASYNGAYCYDGHVFTRFGSESGLGFDQIWTLVQDREGVIWFGTSGKGLAGLRGERFMSFNRETGLDGDVVFGLHADAQGGLWVGSEDGGLNRISRTGDGRWLKTSFKDKPLTPDGNIYVIEEDSKGHIWLGLRRGGIRVWDGKNFHQLNFGNDNIDKADIFHILRDSRDRMWLATFWGVFVVEDGNPRAIKIDTSLIPEEKHQVYYIHEDGDGGFWFATDYGVVKYKGNTYQHYTKKAGFTDGRVRTILKDHEGNTWFGTDEGVFLFRNGKFTSIGTADGLASDKIYLMHFDRRGNLWLGSNKGLDRINVINYLRIDSLVIRHFGKTEGFTGVECNANSVCEGEDGSLWFGTVKGVMRYNYKMDELNTKEPLTRLLGVRLLSEPIAWGAFSDSLDSRTGIPYNLILPYDMNHLTFDYEAISLMAPEKVRYMYMLDGLDTKWSAPTDKKDIPYPYLPPGEYVFKVKACNSDGIWNKEAVSLGLIVINPPFWKTLWFYVLCILSIVFGIFAYIKYRERRLREEKRVLENTVAERTREVVEQKEIIEAKNKDITDSINYAKRIQEALLPPRKITGNAFTDSFILFSPKDIVSGDFYWYGRKNGLTFIAAVDCTGHGVPGAFMSMIGHNLLNQLILEQGLHDPGIILTALNKNLKKAFRQSNKETDTRDGMDLALCVLHPKEDLLCFAGAMRPLYLNNNKGLQEIKGNKQAIGGLTDEDYPFDTHKLTLARNDVFYIFSDGYADQFGGPHGKKFMIRKWRNLVMECSGLSMDEQFGRFSTAFSEWKGNQVQVDDVLVIGVMY